MEKLSLAQQPQPRVTRVTAADLLAEAEENSPPRLTSQQLHRLLSTGEPLVVDTRTPTDVTRVGWIAGSVHAPRTVTEWRADPSSSGHHKAFDSFSRTVVVVCNQGYSSRLAAANLRRMGYASATDLVGGIEQWIANALPLVQPAAEELETLPRCSE